VLDGLAGLSRSQVLACCALTHRMLHAPAVIRVSILVQGGALRAPLAGPFLHCRARRACGLAPGPAARQSRRRAATTRRAPRTE